MDVSSEMIHSLLPVFLVTGLGASALTVGVIDGAAEALALGVKVFSGLLSDLWGKRKPLALWGYGLGAISKPLFALASTSSWVLTARLVDRLGKGIRGAPRDAMVADLAPAAVRGAAYGLRQALDTVGAFLGPVLALGLMVLWDNDFRAIFGVAIVPGLGAVLLLFFCVREPERPKVAHRPNPLAGAQLKQLSRPYWWVVGIGVLFTLARFSEAFLVLRAVQGGLRITFAPLVMIGMNLAFALTAYPFGKLADRYSSTLLLAAGLFALVAADLGLAYGDVWIWLGILFWGLHLALTQGLLAKLVADAAPEDLRGTAFGFFNLLSGMAMLAASVCAGWLWDRFGAEQTFLAGAGFCLLALAALFARGYWGQEQRPIQESYPSTP